MSAVVAKVRDLKLADLGISPPTTSTATVEEIATEIEPAPPPPEFEALPDEDRVLARVRAALDLGFAGVILSGPPGTGKSWYAKRIAGTLAVAPDAIRVVQFHASYQYEDFMEGFVPTPSGGFRPEDKIFPLLCSAAEGREGRHVLVIDEFSRCDVARVFGEALTYLEPDKRGQDFVLSSGKALRVPPNLALICTMNPWDKGVDELDVALERRFAQVDILPDPDKLRELLIGRGAVEGFADAIVRFFRKVQDLDDETLHVGHSYFLSCLDERRARLTWELRLYPFFKKACRLSPATLETIVAEWLDIFVQLERAAEAAEAAPAAAAGHERPTAEAG